MCLHLTTKPPPIKEAIHSAPNRRNTRREEDKDFFFRLLEISETKNSPPSKKRSGLDEAWIGLFDFFPNNPGDSIIRFSLCPYIVIAKHGKYFCHMGPLFLHILLIRHPTHMSLWQWLMLTLKNRLPLDQWSQSPPSNCHIWCHRVSIFWADYPVQLCDDQSRSEENLGVIIITSKPESNKQKQFAYFPELPEAIHSLTVLTRIKQRWLYF